MRARGGASDVIHAGAVHVRGLFLRGGVRGPRAPRDHRGKHDPRGRVGAPRGLRVVS